MNDIPAGIGHNSGWGAPPEAEAAAPVVKYEVKYPGQPETEEPEAFRLRRNAEIQHWLAAKPILETAKSNEMDLRNKVTITLFPSPKKGTQRYDIGGGYNVKLIHGITYTLGDKDATREDGSKKPIREQIEELEKKIIAEVGEVGRIYVDRLIKWKPELSATDYEKLDPKDPVESVVAVMISEFVTTKPASPQLTFEEPKEK